MEAAGLSLTSPIGLPESLPLPSLIRWDPSLLAPKMVCSPHPAASFNTDWHRCPRMKGRRDGGGEIFKEEGDAAPGGEERGKKKNPFKADQSLITPQCLEIIRISK